MLLRINIDSGNILEEQVLKQNIIIKTLERVGLKDIFYNVLNIATAYK